MSQLLHVPIAARRIYGLDILRAFAIFAVVLGHGTYLLPPALVPVSDAITFDGVSLFFVLSGFLIGGILIKTLDTQEANWTTLFDFWVKRWFRTVPPYFLALLLTMALSWNLPDFKFTYYKEFFVFLQNFKSPQVSFFPEAWSLSIEEWFYLLIPSATFVLIAIRGNAKTSLLAVAISVLLLVTAYRYYKYLHLPPRDLDAWDLNFRKIVITRLDSLMYGVIAAYLSYFAPARWLNHKGLKLMAGIALLMFGKLPPSIDNYGLYSCVFSFSLTSIGTMLVLPYLSTLVTGSGWLFRLITRLSLISYSAYLLNLSIVQGFIVKPAIKQLGLTGHLSELVAYCSYWLLTMVLSILMYKYFETPVMHLRNKFVGPKPKVAIAASIA